MVNKADRVINTMCRENTEKVKWAEVLRGIVGRRGGLERRIIYICNINLYSPQLFLPGWIASVGFRIRGSSGGGNFLPKKFVSVAMVDYGQNSEGGGCIIKGEGEENLFWFIF